jgi:hypothetical protein
VFAGQKITGVVLVANEGKQGQHLTARSMAGFLTAQDDEGRGTFAEAIGWHKQVLREQRQQRQFERMCMAIENEADVLDAMIGALVPKRQGEAALPAEPEAVTRAFNELEDDLAVKCIVSAFSTLCQKGKKRQAECISRFAEAWLPVLFEHDDQLDGFRAKLEDPACSYIEAPTSLPLPTELMMAEAEGKLARLELSARKVLISRQDLGFFAEPGLDEEGKERQRQVDEILSRRFLTAAEQNKFAPAIDAVVEAIGKDKDNLGELAGLMDRTKKQQRLAEILEELFDAYQRHFYYRFKTDEGFDLQGLEEIKRRYPTLVFLLTRCRDEAGEGKRYSRLSRIIAAAKGDHTFCEEIAKYA